VQEGQVSPSSGGTATASYPTADQPVLGMAEAAQNDNAEAQVSYSGDPQDTSTRAVRYENVGFSGATFDYRIVTIGEPVPTEPVGTPVTRLAKSASNFQNLQATDSIMTLQEAPLDQLGGADLANNAVIIPSTGVYRIETSILVGWNDSNYAFSNFEVGAEINGSLEDYARNKLSANVNSPRVTVTGSAVRQLSEGDTIKLAAAANDIGYGQAFGGDSASGTYIEVTKLS
jgi:hypothetical protein